MWFGKIMVLLKRPFSPLVSGEPCLQHQQIPKLTPFGPKAYNLNLFGFCNSRLFANLTVWEIRKQEIRIVRGV
jgi:hypothetical protein